MAHLIRLDDDSHWVQTCLDAKASRGLVWSRFLDFMCLVSPRAGKEISTSDICHRVKVGFSEMVFTFFFLGDTK